MGVAGHQSRGLGQAGPARAHSGPLRPRRPLHGNVQVPWTEAVEPREPVPARTTEHMRIRPPVSGSAHCDIDRSSRRPRQMRTSRGPALPGRRRLAIVGDWADIESWLAILRRARPVFHSGADFQQALAWAGQVDGEQFELLSQGAQDIRAYDVVKDVQRVERFVEGQPGWRGAVLVLANDPGYWSRPGHGGATDADAFRIYEDQVISGRRAWGPGTGAGTMKGRETVTELRGDCRCRWSEYSALPGRLGAFGLLAITINGPGRPRKSGRRAADSATETAASRGSRLRPERATPPIPGTRAHRPPGHEIGRTGPAKRDLERSALLCRRASCGTPSLRARAACGRVEANFRHYIR